MELFTLNTDYGLVRGTEVKVLIKNLGNGNELRILKEGPSEDFKMKFTNRLTTDMQTALYQFYKARNGNFEAFNIIDPFDGTTLKVRFKDPRLEEEFFMHLVENSEIALKVVN